MINPTQTVSPSQPVAYSFPSRSPEYALRSAHKRAIVLRCAKVSQSESFDDLSTEQLSSVIGLAHLSVLLCMDPSMHTHIQEYDVPMTCGLNFLYSCFLFWEQALQSAVPSRILALCYLLGPPSLNHLHLKHLQLPASGTFGATRENPSGFLTRALVNLIALLYRDLFSSHFLPPIPPRCPDPSATFL